MKRTLFKEIQHFRQTWLWGLLLGIFIFPFWEIISDLDNTNENLTNFFGWIFIGAMSLFLWFFYKIKLTTIITEQDISIWFNFFHSKPKIIAWNEIQKAEIITYNPIMDYGGWGIRCGGLNSVAYNVSGNQGLQLYLKNDQKILIGTQKPEELRNSIKKIMPMP
jgi:hypothetical protein